MHSTKRFSESESIVTDFVCVNIILEIIKFLSNFYLLFSAYNSTIKSVRNCLAVLRPYWCCFQLLNDNDEKLSLNQFIDEAKKAIANESIDQNKSEIKSEDTTSTDDDLINLFDKLDLNIPENRTCICSDDRMTKHFNLIEPFVSYFKNRKSLSNQIKANQ